MRRPAPALIARFNEAAIEFIAEMQLFEDVALHVDMLQ